MKGFIQFMAVIIAVAAVGCFWEVTEDVRHRRRLGTPVSWSGAIGKFVFLLAGFILLIIVGGIMGNIPALFTGWP